MEISGLNFGSRGKASEWSDESKECAGFGTSPSRIRRDGVTRTAKIATARRVQEELVPMSKATGTNQIAAREAWTSST